MNKEIKKDWLKRAKQHQKADKFIQGQWLNGMVGEFKSGCFYGCMTQTEDDTLLEASNQMELPLWLIHVAERIFEGLPKEEAMKFPVQFIKSITIGKDYNQVYKDWNIAVLTDQLQFVDKDSEQEKAIKQCIDLFKMEVITESAAWSARSAAWSAWSAARSAACSAAWSAWSAARSAESAARSAACSAAWSAWSAARSAESAAWSARSAHYVNLRDILLKLI